MAEDIPPTWEHYKWQFAEGYKPLSKEDFKAPPIPLAGNRSPRPIYESVGKALSQWSVVETLITRVFIILIQSQTWASSRAFGAIINLQSRLAAIDAAAEFCFQGSRRSFLKNIRRHFEIVKVAGARRNEIAHGSVSKIEKYGFVLLPDINDPRKNPLGGPNVINWQYRYTSKQIDEFTRLFEVLFKETFNLTTDLNNEVQRRFPLTKKP